jgi:hypothetical protein
VEEQHVAASRLANLHVIRISRLDAEGTEQMLFFGIGFQHLVGGIEAKTKTPTQFTRWAFF